MKERRKLTNIVVNPSALWRLSVPFLLLLASSLTAIFLTCLQLSRAIEELEFPDGQAVQIQSVLSQVTIDTSTAGTIGMFLISLLTLILWIIYSHRLLGPVIPIRRHIESLCEGNYATRITLRKGDEFQDIAEDLNRLATILQNKTHEKQ